MFVIESAIAKAAQALGVSPREIQQRNLLKEGSTFSCSRRRTRPGRRSMGAC
ncbi:MAG: hypothetical protein R2818_08935 [Flavobacteriales bacterium]